MEPTLNMLLAKRDFDFAAFSKKIIEIFGERLTKAVRMTIKSDRHITWHSVADFPAVDNFVVVSGSLEVRPGDMLNTESGQLLATEENYKNITNPVRYILSAKVLQFGSVEAIFQHINFVDSLATTLESDEIVRVLNAQVFDTESMLENPMMADVLNQITRPTVYESFDATQLSDEQFQSLRLCSTSAKKPRVQ